MSTLKSTLTWHEINDESDYPEDDKTVLVYHPDYDEKTERAFFDGDRWLSAEGYDLDEVPTHWAEIPLPPDCN